MSAQWDALWKPRDSSSTWHAEWSVPVSPSTRLLVPEYDGSSRHRAARVAPKPLDAAALPEDFELGVVFGPSGSGKSSLLQDLAEHYGLAAARRDAFEFPASMAVCSHAGLRGEGIDRLSCVGLNRVPSWLKPAQVLSDGERQRVLCALSLETGAILDDFAVVVDERNAASMAASLSKFVRGRGLRRVLVSTTKRCVLPFLAPDFVLFTLSGCVKLNPFPLEQRRVALTISSDVVGFSGGKGGGWQGPPDDATLEAKKDIGAGQARSPGKVLGGTVPQTLSVSVDADDSCHQAANAFDFDFDGRSEQVVHVLNAEALHQATGGGHWSLGAVVGPSGTGKSHNMRQLVGRGGGQALLSWDDRAVIDHLHADPEQARALAAAVALPVAAALRPWAVLSTGERARAEVARRLGTAGSGCPLCLDEFTSCLDRTTARQVCWGVACYIRSAVPPVQVVVATVHEDILGWLLPDWVLESRCGTVTVMSGPEPTVGTLDAVHRMRTLRPNLSATSGADVEELRELLKPPTLSFSLSRLDGCAESRRVYCELFEEHHYLKGSSPMCLYGLLLRETTSNQPVAFHGVALKVGVGCTNMTLRESRLVVLPDFQGFGLGPKLSNYVGGLLTKSGADLYAVTAHPRLGAYRQMHPELWRPTCMNLKASKGTMAASLRKTRAKERGDKRAVAADVGDAAAPRPRVCFSHRFVGAATLEKPAAAELALDASPASQCSTRAPQTPGDSLSATQASQESGPSATDSGENFESAWRARQSKASIARKSPAPKHHIKGAARKDTPLSAALAGCLACRREAMIAQKMPLPRGRPPRHTCGGSPRPKQKVTAADADDAAAPPAVARDETPAVAEVDAAPAAAAALQEAPAAEMDAAPAAAAALQEVGHGDDHDRGLRRREQLPQDSLGLPRDDAHDGRRQTSAVVLHDGIDSRLAKVYAAMDSTGLLSVGQQIKLKKELGIEKWSTFCREFSSCLVMDGFSRRIRKHPAAASADASAKTASSSTTDSLGLPRDDAGRRQTSAVVLHDGIDSRLAKVYAAMDSTGQLSEKQQKKLKKELGIKKWSTFCLEFISCLVMENGRIRKRPAAASVGATVDKGTYEYVTDQTHLDTAISKLQEEELIAVDIEGGMNRSTRICLIQAATLSGRCFIFDMVALADGGAGLHHLKELLETSGVLKVFHDCRGDAEALEYHLGIRLSHVFDTQVAWALLYPEDRQRPGLNIVLQRFGGKQAMKKPKKSMGSRMDLRYAVNIMKDDPRDAASIWEQRPLPEDLLLYAASDVRRLVAAAVKMCKELPRDVGVELRERTELQLMAFRDSGTSAFDGLEVGDRRSFRFQGGSAELVAPGSSAIDDHRTFDLEERREEVLKLIAVLPEGLQAAIEPYADGLVDVALDLGRCPVVRRRRITGEVEELDLLAETAITESDLRSICETVGPFDSQRRAGIDGTLHRISYLPGKAVEVAGLTLRIGFAAPGSLRLLQDVVASRASFLLLGPPGVGKTTILRAACRELSQKDAVVIVESSDEIAGGGDVCHPSVGRARRHRALGRGDERHGAMLQAVENHTPSHLVIDEIGTQQEVRAARSIAARGVRLVATAHGQDLRDIMENRDLNNLMGGTQTVILAGSDPRYNGIQKSVQERVQEPVFDVLVEIRHPGCIAVHRDVAAAVDAVLGNRMPLAEVRELDPESGELFVTRKSV